MKAKRALGDLVYPCFPPELKYMESRSALRQAKKTDRGYEIPPDMIESLATNLKLIGVWTWGDTDPIPDNHECIVPAELFFAAYDLAGRRGKHRGRGIKHDPLDWCNLLYCHNHEIPERKSAF